MDSQDQQSVTLVASPEMESGSELHQRYTLLTEVCSSVGDALRAIHDGDESVDSTNESGGFDIQADQRCMDVHLCGHYAALGEVLADMLAHRHTVSWFGPRPESPDEYIVFVTF